MNLKIKIVSWLLLLCWSLISHAQNCLTIQQQCLLTLENNLPAPGKFYPLPKYGDKAWSTLNPDRKKALIKNGEARLNFKWQPIDLELFGEYQRTGNRKTYETPYFRKRTALTDLAMAEIVEGKGHFLPQINAGIKSLLDEAYWGVPAHYPHSAPQIDDQKLELFGAETGSLLAWTIYMFGDAIDQQLATEVQSEIQRRIIDEAIANKEFWRGTISNWNPWICSNWLTCVLLAEPDKDKQIKSIELIAESLDQFINKYPDDGACTEGPTYYDRATGSLLDCLMLLDKATNGAIDIRQCPKLTRMVNYICDMNIDNTHSVNFADAPPYLSILPVWYPGALYMDNNELKSLVLNATHKLSIANQINQGCGYTLGRQLSTLYSMVTESDVWDGGTMQASEMPFDSWYEQSQILTARSKPNASEGLFLAIKGGNNNESHNHNDVGNFVIYKSGKPIIIDIGQATYSANTFNKQRYIANKNTRSAYHNTPLINGVEQLNGKDYKASSVKANVSKKKAKLTMDLAKAYPKEAHVDKWQRTVEMKRNDRVTISESYKLTQLDQLSQIVLITPIKPEISNGIIVLDGATITYNGKQISATSEIIDYSDDNFVNKNWPTLYRILLTPLSNKLSNTVKYTIK